MPLRRIGYVGDVHAEDERLALAIRVLRGEGVDEILCVGDVVDGPGDLERAVALLREEKISTVRGNHERWFAASDMRDLPDAFRPELVSPRVFEFLTSLPPLLFFETIAGRLLLCHGLGEDDMASLLPWESGSAIRDNLALGRILDARTTPIVISGHSHRRAVRSIEGHLFVNAGTIFREHDPSFGILDLESLLVRTFVIDDDLSAHEIERIAVIEPDLSPETRR